MGPGRTTASGRSGRAALRVEGVVSAREDAQDGCERGKVPRGKPGGAGGLPRVHLATNVPWMRSTGGLRRAKQSRPRGERWR